MAFANTAIAALLGTAVGALIFFVIESIKRRQRLEDEQVAAANIAVFALSRAWRDLEAFRQHRIEPVRKSPARWFQMVPGEIHSPPSGFDAAALAFLFETDTSDIPGWVQFELDRFEAIRADIRDRARIHITELQPRIEAAFAFDPSTVPGATKDQLVQVAGPRIYQTVLGLTETIIAEVDGALTSIQVTAQKLRDASIAKFPKRKIIRFVQTAKAQV